MNTMVIVYLIIYAVIAGSVSAIFGHFYKNKNDIDCVAIGLTWPIVAIVFICCLPYIAVDYIKDVWHDKFSKEIKEYKRILVEDTLDSIKKEKANSKSKEIYL
jgi:hypothetical protein